MLWMVNEKSVNVMGDMLGDDGSENRVGNQEAFKIGLAGNLGGRMGWKMGSVMRSGRP